MDVRGWPEFRTYLRAFEAYKVARDAYMRMVRLEGPDPEESTRALGEIVASMRRTNETLQVLLLAIKARQPNNDGNAPPVDEVE